MTDYSPTPADRAAHLRKIAAMLREAMKPKQAEAMEAAAERLDGKDDR